MPEKADDVGVVFEPTQFSEERNLRQQINPNYRGRGKGRGYMAPSRAAPPRQPAPYGFGATDIRYKKEAAPVSPAFFCVVD